MLEPPKENSFCVEDEDDFSDTTFLKGSLNVLPDTARHRQTLVKNINMLSAASLHNSLNSNEELSELKTKSVDGRLPSARPPIVSNFGILKHIQVLEDNASSATKIPMMMSKNKETYTSADSTSRNNLFMKLLSHKQP